MVLNSKKVILILLAIIVCLDTNAITNALKVKINSGTYADETVVRFLPNATTGFDANYDAYKMFSLNALVPAVFTKMDLSSNLCINALPIFNEQVDMELFVHVKSSGTYTFQSIEIGAFEASTKIVLEDKSTGISYNFKNGVSLTFNMSANTIDAQSRFVIHFTPATNNLSTGIDVNELPEPLRISLQEGSLVLNMQPPSPLKLEIYIYSITGQQVYHYSNNELYSLSENIVLNSEGIYIINTIINNQVSSQKISYIK